MKLHAGVDEQTGCVIAAVVTGGDGKGSGDVSQGATLIGQAARDGPVGVVIGDGAYDAAALYTTARDHDAVMLAPLFDTAAYGLDPDRDQHLAPMPIWIGSARTKSVGTQGRLPPTLAGRFMLGE